VAVPKGPALQIADHHLVHTTIVSPRRSRRTSNRDWVIVDCRFDLQNEQWGRDQYLTSHIPGAVYASLSHDMAGPKTGSNGRIHCHRSTP
jgi:3-mercaptopyruvate sulfurtransferase SseA